MKKRLGIIGGGQLGMMITEAARNLSDEISEITVLDPTENCPAAQVGAKQIVGDFKDKNAIVKLAEQSDIITYEIESGNTDVLSKLKADIETIAINPGYNTRQAFTKEVSFKKWTASFTILRNYIPR